MLLELAKAVDHRLWTHQHPLRQFEAVLSQEVRGGVGKREVGEKGLKGRVREGDRGRVRQRESERESENERKRERGRGRGMD